MRLQVESLTARFFYVDVDDDAKTADVMRVIGEQENLPIDRLILVLYHNEDNQVILTTEDETPLADYGVQDGSLLYLFFTSVLPDDDPIQDPFPAIEPETTQEPDSNLDPDSILSPEFQDLDLNFPDSLLEFPTDDSDQKADEGDADGNGDDNTDDKWKKRKLWRHKFKPI